MKHRATRELYQYWNQRRGLRAAPDRADIDPGHLKGVLADTFMLSVDAAGRHPFRIAGTRLCALFCHELKGKSFVDLWDERSRMRGLLDTVVQDGVGFVAGAHAVVNDIRTDMEVLVLPLTQEGQRIRLIGALVPLETSYWLGVRPASRLALGMHRHVGGPLERFGRRFVAGAPAERMREGLRVLDGGRLRVLPLRAAPPIYAENMRFFRDFASP
jgi:hypothetical protein